MNDRELLELAAKAAGFKHCGYLSGIGLMIETENSPKPSAQWNPLTDNGDALRLAAALCIDIEINQMERRSAARCFESGMAIGAKEHWTDEIDRFAATRRAIVRAAAAIAKMDGE